MRCPYLNRIPNSIITDIADKRGLLILDSSNEAPLASTQHFEAIHATLGLHNISPEQVFLLSQNRSLIYRYSRYCATEGIAERINIDFYHSFIKNFLVEASARIKHSEQLIRRLASLEAGHIPNHGRIFLSQNYTPRPSRVWFVGWLLSHNLLSKGYVSLGIGGAKGSHWKDSYSSIPKWLTSAEDISNVYDRLCDILPLTIDDMSKFGRTSPTSVAEQTLDAHLDSSLQIVLETEMTTGLRDRITEKTLKPLLTMQTAIILGNPMSLAWLRQFGFKTWDASFSEEYDLIQSPRKRVISALESFIAYTNADSKARRDMFCASIPAIIHNAKWLKEGAIGHYEDHFEIPLYRRMLDAVEKA